MSVGDAGGRGVEQAPIDRAADGAVVERFAGRGNAFVDRFEVDRRFWVSVRCGGRTGLEPLEVFGVLGVAGLFDGALMMLGGVTFGAFNVGFTVVSILATGLLFAMGVILWRRADKLPT